MYTNIIPQHACPDCQSKDAEIARLRWNEGLGMFNQAGLGEAIRTLPNDTTYTVILADIDRLKSINAATKNHIQTNRYLCAGLAVRDGEIAGQLLGDEILFILAERPYERSFGEAADRRHEDSSDAFVARITRQLAGQALTTDERLALSLAQRCPIQDAKLSATFAAESGVTAAQVPSVIERLSCEVLKLKAERDERIWVGV